jgi:hypothetical protein
MRFAAWNLNHRAGYVPFQPDAVEAAISLDADIIVFTEYFPRQYAEAFEARLESAGWCHQLKTPAPPSPREKFNHTLIASRHPLVLEQLPLPFFDHQLPANALLVHIPHWDLRLLGLRVPAYTGVDRPLIRKSWEWVEQAAALLRQDRALIVGDLNCEPASPPGKGGDIFRRVLSTGWHHGTPAGPSFFSKQGHCTTPDQVLYTTAVRVHSASFQTELGNHQLAGGQKAISDHAALVFTLG